MNRIPSRFAAQRGVLRHPIPGLLLAFSITGCMDGAQTDTESAAVAAGAAPEGIVLEKVARYGWNELADSTRPLSDRERAYGGAVLGNVRDVVEGPDGRVYVLDMAFQKIVVFDSTGEYERLILGGAGRGPGEFGAPQNIAFGPGGDLWVFDQSLARLTRFDPSGVVVETIPAPIVGMHGMTATSELLYASRLVMDSSALVFAFDPAGAVVAELAFPTSEDLRLRTPAIVARLGRGPGDAVFIAYPQAGTWSRVHGTSVSARMGRPVDPDARPFEHVDDRVGIRIMRNPVQANILGGLSDGTVVQFYGIVPDTGRTRLTRPIYHLAVHDTAGRYLGTADRTFGYGRFGVSRSSPAVYVVEETPYPHVQKLRVVASRTDP